MLLLVAGCSQQAPEQDDPDALSSAAIAPVEGRAAPDPAADVDPYSSDYTDFSLGDCRVTARAEEGVGVDYICPGRGDIALFAHDGDGRMDLNAGVRNDRFQSLGAFNSIGDSVEWRMKDGVPFAIIFRYRDDSEQGGGRTVLAVERIGTANQPGCRVAQLAGSTHDANARARAIADSEASGFDCAANPRIIGAAE